MEVNGLCMLLFVVYIKHPSALVHHFLLCHILVCLDRITKMLCLLDYIRDFNKKKELCIHWYISYKCCDFMWREALSVALSAVVDSYLEISTQTQ